jgi:hypothetical protein
MTPFWNKQNEQHDPKFYISESTGQKLFRVRFPIK